MESDVVRWYLLDRREESDELPTKHKVDAPIV